MTDYQKGDLVWHRTLKCLGRVVKPPLPTARCVRVQLTTHATPQYYHQSQITKEIPPGVPASDTSIPCVLDPTSEEGAYQAFNKGDQVWVEGSPGTVHRQTRGNIDKVCVIMDGERKPRYYMKSLVSRAQLADGTVIVGKPVAAEGIQDAPPRPREPHPAACPGVTIRTVPPTVKRESPLEELQRVRNQAFLDLQELDRHLLLMQVRTLLQEAISSLVVQPKPVEVRPEDLLAGATKLQRDTAIALDSAKRLSKMGLL